MALVSPTAVFTGYTFASNTVSIPLSALPGLSSAEADASTGDIRAVLTAIIEQANVAITALSAGSKPTNFTIASTRSTTGSNIEVNWSVKGTFPLTVSSLNYPSES